MATVADNFTEGSDTALTAHTPTGPNAGTGWTEVEKTGNEVQRILDQFDPVIRSFESEGKTKLSTRQLLKMVGFAMNVRHLSTGSLALLDRPNAAWDDSGLSQLFDALSDEYEIDERYDILKEKLDIIFKNVEFILGFLDTRRSLMLEFTIVLLIVIEILIFGYEIWFL